MKKGFSLIEIMAAVSIMVIVASWAASDWSKSEHVAGAETYGKNIAAITEGVKKLIIDEKANIAYFPASPASEVIPGVTWADSFELLKTLACYNTGTEFGTAAKNYIGCGMSEDLRLGIDQGTVSITNTSVAGIAQSTLVFPAITDAGGIRLDLSEIAYREIVKNDTPHPDITASYSFSPTLGTITASLTDSSTSAVYLKADGSVKANGLQFNTDPTIIATGTACLTTEYGTIRLGTTGEAYICVNNLGLPQWRTILHD